MTLHAGTRLGPYELQSLLGAGGMGEVYRARDSRLSRSVAIKVLPAHLRQDAGARERFEREARAISALNHPHICHLYDVGEQDGHNFLVMELLEGETLSSRLLRGRLPLDLALRYAAEVGDALDAAHRRGIVHRDLKPGNTFLTAHGECKVLDFGLAKLEEAQLGADSPTAAITAPELLTSPGSAVGTAAYMSPEQVRGENLDARSDIFSFGIMLYEMVTGTLPFRGKTSGAVADGILNRDPKPAAEINPEVPAELERILGKALEKDRELRYQSAAELRADLKRLQRDSTGKIAAAGSQRMEGRAQSGVRPLQAESQQRAVEAFARATRSSSRTKAIAISAAVLLILVVGTGVWWFRSRSDSGPSQPMSFLRLTDEGGRVSSANISPDGKYVVYETVENGKGALWLRQTATSATVRVVPESEHNFETDFGGTTFSPDNNFIYFLHTDTGEQQQALYSVPALGGIPKKVVSNIDSPVTFSPDGKRMAFVRIANDLKKTSLVIVDADGRNERVLLELPMTRQYFSRGGPSWSPDAEHIAVVSAHPDKEGFYGTVDLVDMRGQIRRLSPKLVIPEEGRLAWMGDGSGLVFTGFPNEQVQRWQIFFLSYPRGEVSRITNDMDSYGSYSLGVTRDGSALVTIQTGNQYHVWRTSPASGYANVEQIVKGRVAEQEIIDARGGKLVYGTDRVDGSSIWVLDLKNGARTEVSDKGYTPRLSPDGKQVAFSALDAQVKEHLWIVNSDGSGLRQITMGNGDHLPIFSPNGRLLYYVHFSGEQHIYKMPMEGRAAEKVSDRIASALDISPDGKMLTVAYPDEKTGHRRWGIMDVATGKLVQTLPIERIDSYPVFMPSGDAVAYVDMHDGVGNVWKMSLRDAAKTELTHFDQEEITSMAVSPEGELLMTRGHRVATVVLMRNFRGDHN